MRTGSGGPCNHCGRTSSPCWRKGPDTKPTLCNACGARWLVKKNLDNYMPGAGSPTQRQSPSPFAHGAGGKSKLSSAFFQSSGVGGYQSFGGGTKQRKRKASSSASVPVTYAEIATTARIFSDPPSPLRTATITVQHSPPMDRTSHAASGTAFTLQLPSGDMRPGFTVTHEFTFPATLPPERKAGEAAQFTNITASTLALLHATPNGTLSRGSIPVVRRRRKPDRSTVRTVF